MLLTRLLVWRLKAFFSVFSVGLKLILNPHGMAYRLRNIAGLIPIVTFPITRRTSEFPPVVRLPAIRPLQMPTMYTYWGLMDSLRMKALYQVGCLPQVASKPKAQWRTEEFRFRAKSFFDSIDSLAEGSNDCRPGRAIRNDL
jgi:hypothetical protein